MSRRLTLGRHALLVGWLVAVAVVVVNLLTGGPESNRVASAAITLPPTGLVALLPGMLLLASSPEVGNRETSPGSRRLWVLLGLGALIVVGGFVAVAKVFDWLSTLSGLEALAIGFLAVLGILAALGLAMMAWSLIGLAAIKALWDLVDRVGERWPRGLLLGALVSAVVGWGLWPPIGAPSAGTVEVVLSLLSTVVVPLTLVTVVVVGLHRTLAGPLPPEVQDEPARFDLAEP